VGAQREQGRARQEARGREPRSHQAPLGQRTRALSGVRMARGPLACT
jgi:hypothetical protein